MGNERHSNGSPGGSKGVEDAAISDAYEAQLERVVKQLWDHLAEFFQVIRRTRRIEGLDRPAADVALAREIRKTAPVLLEFAEALDPGGSDEAAPDVPSADETTAETRRRRLIRERGDGSSPGHK